MKSLKEQILEGAAADLADVEKALSENLNPHLELVRTVAEHLLFAGGKRMRPLLAILSARMCGREGAEVTRLSTVFEYLHAATLLHDDVVDDSAVRRGKPAAHTVHGAAVTVLVGDFLLARTCSIATETGMLPVIQTITDVTGVMSEGEILQLMGKSNVDLSEDQYIDTIERKTAVLLAASCKVGGLFAGASPERAQALWDFGRALGLAFQMADDLLDYTGDPAATGKAVGTDLREGKLTLPLIIALKNAATGERAFMERVIRAQGFTNDEFSRIVSIISRSGGISHTMSEARGHVDRALAILDTFPPSPPRDLLAKLAEYALARKS